MTLADRLRHAMSLRGVSQKQLADAVGVKPPSVNGWLSAKAKFLRGENLLKAAAALEVEQEWLASGNGPMDANSPPADKPHPPSQYGRPDPETLASAMEFLSLVSQRQIVPIDFSTDAEALLYAYDLIAQVPARFDREQAVDQMVEWLRGRRRGNVKVDKGDADRPRGRGLRKG